MGILGVILFLAIGFGAAVLFNKLFLQQRQDALRTIQDNMLKEMLSGSKTYAHLQGDEEYSIYRSDDRDCDNDLSVEQIGTGGDGSRVLQLYKDRKV